MIAQFRTHAETIAARRRERAETQLRAILAERLMQRIESRVTAIEMGKLADRIAARTVDPYSAADQILGNSEPGAALDEGPALREASGRPGGQI